MAGQGAHFPDGGCLDFRLVHAARPQGDACVQPGRPEAQGGLPRLDGAFQRNGHRLFGLREIPGLQYGPGPRRPRDAGGRRVAQAVDRGQELLGGVQTFLPRARPDDGDGAGGEDEGQRGWVVEAPGHGDGLVGEVDAPVQVIGPEQLGGEDGQQAGPDGAVLRGDATQG
jgi:hypothetical protein